MSEWLLPLFPLNVVLFPRTSLPLHIFEERYKEMIADCLENGGDFGVVLAQEQSVADTGCAASITEVLKRYDDGRMDIIVRGSRRFEILLLDQEKAYLRGSPQFFDDDGPAVPLKDSRRQRAVELCRKAREILRLEESEEESAELLATDEQLSYQLMARLPVDLEFKQSLLSLRSEEERLTRVISHIEKLLDHLAVLVKARANAGANGKGIRPEPRRGI